MQLARKNKFLLLLLPFSLCGVQAQNRLKGKVESISGDVEGIHVINKTSESATITDSKGYFEVPVKLGDTLLFSSVQFQKAEIIVSENLLSTSPLIVHLQEKVNVLDEVVVKNLTGNLITDLNRIKINGIGTSGLPNAHVQPLTQTQRRLEEATGHAIKFGHTSSYNPKISMDIAFLMNMISGRTKILKNRLKLEKQIVKLEEIRRGFPDDFFISSGIPKEKIYDFLYFCSIQEKYQELIRNKDLMTLPGFLKEQARHYIKINTPIDRY